MIFILLGDNMFSIAKYAAKIMQNYKENKYISSPQLLINTSNQCTV